MERARTAAASDIGVAAVPRVDRGAAIVCVGGSAVVYLDPRLGAKTGGRHWRTSWCTTSVATGPQLDAPAWRAVVAAEERRVNDEVARRLLPLHELLEAAEAVEDFGHHVTAAELAGAYEVPVDMAKQACALLHRGLHLDDGRQVS